MKFTKLSLAALAAMSIASSAFAVENVKVDGQIKLWYQTVASSATNGFGLFEQGVSDLANATATDATKGGATGDLVAKVRVTGDLTKKAGFGFTMYSASTLGLENNLVAGEALNIGASGGTLNGDSNWPVWLGEAYFTYKAGNTIAKIGRQELDTPLAFTETWNAAPNTFEAAVLINKDLPNTTLVAAYVARGNGSGAGTVGTSFTSYGKTRVVGTATNTVGETDSGAYALGMVGTWIPNLTVHPVYYNVQDLAHAYWVDATYNAGAVKVGAQYAKLEATGITEKVTLAAVTDKSVDGYAFEVSGALSGVNLSASYSDISSGNAALAIANTATGVKTKLYTASILSDGRVAAQPDTTSYKVSASTKLAGFDLGASYGSYEMGANTGSNGSNRTATTGKRDLTEVDLSVGTKIDDINLNVYYVNQTAFNAAKDDRQAIRVIAAINF